VFTLIRLRRNPSMTMLCDIFGISAGIGSRIFITWVLFLEKELDFLLHFSTTSDLQGVPQPKPLQKIKNLRAIKKLSLPSSQRPTYSQYKSSNTFKLLISISPVPHINYVSQLYSGSISDKEIVGRSGFLDKLNPGDVIMADKGFNIQYILAKHECKLNWLTWLLALSSRCLASRPLLTHKTCLYFVKRLVTVTSYGLLWYLKKFKICDYLGNTKYLNQYL
jgi:hypothetical protein